MVAIMKKTTVAGFVLLYAGVLAVGTALAQSPEILSFRGDGQLTWTNSDTNLVYHIEWASSLTDTNGWRSSYETLTDIQSTDSTVTATVPMFFRIVGSREPASIVSTSGQTAAPPTAISTPDSTGTATASWTFKDPKHATGTPNRTSPEELEAGLVLYLPFDVQDAVRTLDLSPALNHGWVHGASWTASGKHGGAYEFDGQDDFIELGPTELYQTQGQLSGCAWMLRQGQSIIVLSNYRGGAGYSGQFFFTVESGGHLDVILGQGPDQYVRYLSAEADIVPADGWHHVAFSYDERLGEGNKIKLYVDGKEIDRYTIQREGTGGAVLQTEDRLRIMAHVASGPNCRTQGKVDEVMLFKQALSAHEIRRIYHMGRSPDGTGRDTKPDTPVR